MKIGIMNEEFKNNFDDKQQKFFASNKKQAITNALKVSRGFTLLERAY